MLKDDNANVNKTLISSSVHIELLRGSSGFIYTEVCNIYWAKTKSLLQRCKRVHTEPHSDFKICPKYCLPLKSYKLHKCLPLSPVYLRQHRTSQLICYTIISLQYTRHVLLDWTRIQEQVLRQQHNYRIVCCCCFFGCGKEHAHGEYIHIIFECILCIIPVQEGQSPPDGKPFR